MNCPLAALLVRVLYVQELLGSAVDSFRVDKDTVGTPHIPVLHTHF